MNIKMNDDDIMMKWMNIRWIRWIRWNDEDERVWWMDKDDNDDEDDENDYYMIMNDISRDKVNELD